MSYGGVSSYQIIWFLFTIYSNHVGTQSQVITSIAALINENVRSYGTYSNFVGTKPEAVDDRIAILSLPISFIFKKSAGTE